MGAILIFCFLLVISCPFSLATRQDVVPVNSAPFQNLIPRFKIPPGELLRYRIPQWEVLYFLKYGVIPFIFYDPNFNRTNFISQVHKFKMYFGDQGPSKIQQSSVKDDHSFREFLKANGYPNYDKLPENAWDVNNRVAEEILRAAVPKLTEEGNRKLTALDIFLQNLDKNLSASFNSSSSNEARDNVVNVIVKKSNNSFFEDRMKQQFWNTFITRYPLSWKYSKSLIRARKFLLDHDPSWIRPRERPVADDRNLKSLRIRLRNVDLNSPADDDGTGGSGGAGGSSEPRRGGKGFQTQGW